MIVKPKFYLSIGYEGKLSAINVQNLPKGTRFVILEVYKDAFYPYRVEFKGARFKKINSGGPYLSQACINLGENSELFFAKK